MGKKEEAAMLHMSGANCAQAVVTVFADELNADKETLFAAAEGFGLGGGNMESICGALSGAMMVASLENSDRNIEAPKTKGSTYKITAKLQEEFEKVAGAKTCKAIKGIETGKVLYSCPDCISLGIKLAEKLLAK